MLYADQILISALSVGIATVRSSPFLLQDLAGDLPIERSTEFLQWMSNTENQIHLTQGFPQRTQTYPCIALTIQQEEEPGEYQVIGSGSLSYPIMGSLSSTGAPLPDTLGTLTLGEGTSQTAFFQAQFRLGIYSLNINLTSWLAGLVRYALLLERNTLTDQGLYQQSLSATDISGDQEGLPDFSFIRALSLSCVWQATYRSQILDPASIVDRFDVTLIDNQPLDKGFLPILV